MISKTIGFRGLAYFQTNPNIENPMISEENDLQVVECYISMLVYAGLRRLSQ